MTVQDSGSRPHVRTAEGIVRNSFNVGNSERHFDFEVDPATLVDGEVLQWNAVGGYWENGPVPGGGGVPAHTLDDHTDVALGPLVTGHVLSYNGVEWVAQAPAAAVDTVDPTVQVVGFNAPTRAATLRAAGVTNSVAIGPDTLAAGLGPLANTVAIGPGAGNSGAGSERTLVGAGAGNAFAGAGATAVGYNAGTAGMGAGCVAIGRNAGLGGMAQGAICIGDGAIVAGVQGLGLTVPVAAVNNDLPAGVDLSGQRLSIQTNVNGAARTIPLYGDPAHVSVFLLGAQTGGGAAVAADGVPKVLTWFNPPLLETAGTLWNAATPTVLTVPDGLWHAMVRVRLAEDAAAPATAIRIVRLMVGAAEAARKVVRIGGAGTGVVEIALDFERLVTGGPQTWSVDITIPALEGAATLEGSGYFFVRYLEAAS